MQKLTILFILSITIGCSRSQEIILLHTNDHHGTLIAIDSFGGVAERATLIGQIREQHNNVLLLDAGDINGADFLTRNNNAEADILAYNYMGYDAMTVGDHDLDRPIKKIREQEKLATFPFLSANINFDEKPLFTPYIIKNYNGFKIGIFGLTTHNTAYNVSYARNLEFENEIEVAQAITNELRNKEKVDMVIALTHLGIRRDDKNTVTSIVLAQLVRGIDIIIDGHSHTYLNKPLVLNNTHIISAFEKGYYLGKGTIKIKNKRMESFSWEAMPVSDIKPDTLVAKIVAPYTVATEKRLDEVIGRVMNPFVKSENLDSNTAYGTLVCDALMHLTRDHTLHRHFAFVDNIPIRDSLEVKNITRKDVMNLFEDNPDVIHITVRGDVIKRLFDNIVRGKNKETQYPQLSRNIFFHYNESTETIERIFINGKPIDFSASYGIVTTSDMVFGDVPYPQLLRRRGLYNTSSSVSSALMDYIEQKRMIEPVDIKRVKFITNSKKTYGLER